MTDRLAKLADLKAAIGTTETSADALLLACIAEATARAEQCVGRPLCRRAGIIEYPWVADFPGTQRLRLHRFPVESIDSVKQAYSATSPDDFDEVDALAEFDDYVVAPPGAGDARNRGTLLRINSQWELRPNWVQVVYTAGFADPARISVALTDASYTASTRTITQTDAFAGYTFAAGDVIVITAPAANAGTYLIASRTSDDAIVLASPGMSATDIADGITSAYDGMIDAPLDLQGGILKDALQLWNFRQTGGVADVELVGGGGYRAKGLKIHEALVAACRPLRTLM